MMGFWDGSGISWTMRKQSAPCSRQITTPTPHQSIFTGRLLFLTPNQQRQSTEGEKMQHLPEVQNQLTTKRDVKHLSSSRLPWHPLIQFTNFRISPGEPVRGVSSADVLFQVSSRCCTAAGFKHVHRCGSRQVNRLIEIVGRRMQ